MSNTGYARVSTDDQDPAAQIDALRAAGCDPIFVEHASGATMQRPEWHACNRGLGKGTPSRSFASTASGDPSQTS